MKRFAMLFSQATAVMQAYKVRTVISVVGVLLGAMSLVMVQNISASLDRSVFENIQSFGDRVVTIYARIPRTPGQMGRRTRVKSMKIEDAQALLNVNNVMVTTPSVRRSFSVRYSGDTIAAMVIGGGVEYFNLRGLSVVNGTIFGDYDRVNKERVAVLGSEVAADLFGGADPIGAEIYIGTTLFKVIGVLAEKGADTNGNSMDNIIVVPIETAMVKLLNQTFITEILVQMRSWDAFPFISEDAAMVLRQNHKIAPGGRNDFEIVNPVDEQTLTSTMTSIATVLGTASAGIAFFIGSVGIFSLMLLIVNQRVTEVGIKRAIGATKRDVLLQFLLESGYIGIVGGVLGIIFGTILSLVVSNVANLPYVVSWLGTLIGFVAALLSGVIAGLYPAFKASRIVPVKALRL